MRKRFKAAHSFPMEDAGLFFFNNCLNSIRTIPVLPRDDKKTDDVDTDAEDHAGDAVRYRVHTPNVGHVFGRNREEYYDLERTLRSLP